MRRVGGEMPGTDYGRVRIEIDLSVIETNARTVVSMCRAFGASVAGVTKSCCGMPEVARSMLEGGVTGIGESRLENIRRLREAGIRTQYYLLRSPHPAQARETVEIADVSLNTELQTLKALSGAARSLGVIHRVIIMVDLGDLREGESPGAVLDLIQEAAILEGIEIAGLGTNLACFAGVVPDRRNMAELLSLSERASELLRRPLPILSGGNSSALHLIKKGIWFEGINHLRIGESIMLGWDITDKSPLEGTRQDAFTIWVPIIELKRKPSVPSGELGPNAFEEVQKFEDEGMRLRALLAIGKQDIGSGRLRPALDGVRVLGSTSDHTVVDVTECSESLSVGDELAFYPDYGSLVGAMTSPYVKKEWYYGTPCHGRALPASPTAHSRNRGF